jgi:predicted RNase H-like HicB family nuclease
MARRIPIIIERHPDGYVAYPVGLRGVVVGEGDTAEAALADVESAIRFHLETFGTEVWDPQDPVLEVQIREAHV